jgi:hypothetical protein
MVYLMTQSVASGYMVLSDRMIKTFTHSISEAGLPLSQVIFSSMLEVGSISQ